MKDLILVMLLIITVTLCVVQCGTAIDREFEFQEKMYEMSKVRK